MCLAFSSFRFRQAPEASRWPQYGPRGPQEGPKKAQDGPKIAREAYKERSNTSPRRRLRASEGGT
eukprot:8639176-Pyramimonas_sp.AAC.1